MITCGLNEQQQWQIRAPSLLDAAAAAFGHSLRLQLHQAVTFAIQSGSNSSVNTTPGIRPRNLEVTEQRSSRPGLDAPRPHSPPPRPAEPQAEPPATAAPSTGPDQATPPSPLAAPARALPHRLPGEAGRGPPAPPLPL